MSTILEATLPAAQFALHETLEREPDAEFEVVRLVADGSDRVMPFLWARTDDPDALRDALEADPSTENVETLAELDDGCLFSMEWTASIRVVLYILIEEQATILDAVGKNDEWYLRVLFPERDSLSATYEFCDEYDVDLAVERVYQLSNSFRQSRFGLTDEQYETILQALEAGYYDVPRDVTLDDLADDLGISHQAVSERLRRGHGTLIVNALGQELDEADVREQRTAVPGSPDTDASAE